MHEWVTAIRLCRAEYSTHALRPAAARYVGQKASMIYRATEDLRVVQIPLGYTMIEITVRYLGFVMPFCSRSTLASSCGPGANQALPA